MSDATLDIVITRLDAFEKRLDKIIDDHEHRLRRVEAWLYALPATLISAAAAVAVAIVK